MAWRCRYFEFESYRTLIKEYYKQGAEWIVAPKPLMSDDMYAQDFPFDDDATAMEWIKAGKFITTEADPCFDAAEFLRCGTDIFVQRSHVSFCVFWNMRVFDGTLYVRLQHMAPPMNKYFKSSSPGIKADTYLTQTVTCTEHYV